MSNPKGRNISLAEIDKASLLHPFTPLAEHLETGPRVIVSGKGCHLKDIDGKEYIDALAGLWCVNVGYGRNEIADAMHRQATQLPYYHSFASMATEPPILLAERVLAMAPEGLSKIFFGTTGSDANDTAVKLVWYYNNLKKRPKKKKIISRRRAYHGVTVAAASMTSLPAVHKAFDLPLEQMRYVDPPYAFWNARQGESDEEYARRLAEELDAFIKAEGPETVGAFIAEPVMGAGGVIVPPATYFKHVQEVLRAHDVLMIADEVICGFGRLGEMFGCNVYGIEPDIMTIAKGITSGYLPLSGTLVSEGVWQVMIENSREVGPFGHGYTYTAHPIPAAAAMANLDIIEREGLVDNAKAVGAYLQEQLGSRIAPHPLVGETRGVGLIGGIELVASKEPRTAFDAGVGAARRANAHALDVGLITRPLLNCDILALSPPLSIQRSEIDEIMDKMELTLDRASSELKKEGLWSG